MKWVFSFFLILFLTAGCNQANQPSSHGGKVKVQQTEPSPAKRLDMKTKADHLAQLARRVRGVKKASAIVINKVAIVGITVDPKLERSRVGTIKYSVAEALKSDPQGATALVTADPGLVQRVREMNEDFRKGRPIAGIAKELADIAGRIIPQTPSDIGTKNATQK